MHAEDEAQKATAEPEHAQAETAAFSSPGKDQLSSPGLSVVTKVQELEPKESRQDHHTFMRDAFQRYHMLLLDLAHYLTCINVSKS